MTDPIQLKEEGNQFFKAGKLEEAISCYTRALKLTDLKDGEKAVIYKNRAACHLKRDDFTGALNDATACKRESYAVY